MTTQIVIQVPLTESEMDKYVGSECEEDYLEGCPICEAWRKWEDNDGTIDVIVDRQELVKWILKEELI